MDKRGSSGERWRKEAALGRGAKMGHFFWRGGGAMENVDMVVGAVEKVAGLERGGESGQG